MLTDLNRTTYKQKHVARWYQYFMLNRTENLYLDEYKALIYKYTYQIYRHFGLKWREMWKQKAVNKKSVKQDIYDKETGLC